MTGLLTLLLALVPAGQPFPLAKAEAEISPAINVDELKAHVYRLASPEFLGRKGPGAARASQHVADLFQKLPVQPAFGKSEESLHRRHIQVLRPGGLFAG